MNGLLWNTVLALVWAAVTGNFTPSNLILGFGLGMVILLFTQRILGTPGYLSHLGKAVGLIVFFIQELIISNLRVAYEVLTPGYRMRPGVVAVPLDVQSDAEITLLSNLISLTPGSIVLDVSTDRRTLYVHAMYADNSQQVRDDVKQGFERRVMEVFR